MDYKKTAGEDGIFPGKELKLWLCHYVPKAWHKVSVIFILKPGRSTYELAKSFRPISLTSLLLKTMERLLDLHIKEGPIKNYPLNPMQHA
jgi:hypothetical protein